MARNDSIPAQLGRKGMADRQPAQVIIAGGGPVGVTLAMDLARLGIASIVLEQRRNVPASPRCNTINARTMEIFRRLGCADKVREVGLPHDHNTDVVYMTQMNDETLTRFKRPTPDDFRNGKAIGVGADWPTPEPQQFVSQMFVEPVLRDHAVEEYSIDLREGLRVESFDQDEDGVTVVAADVDTGERHTFRGDFLVGADGGASMVRTDIGARLEGIPALGKRIATFMRAPFLSKLYARTPAWMYRFIGGCNIVAIDGVDRWLVHIRVPDKDDLQTFDPEPAIFAAVGEPFDYEILQQVRWTPRAMVATKFRSRRVFLCGDAAHIWVPMGGFGMNAGIADATALSWLLAGVLQGWLSEGALNSYHDERASIGSNVAARVSKWVRDLQPLIGNGPDQLPHASPEEKVALGEAIDRINLPEFNCPGMQLGYFYDTSPIIAYDDGVRPEWSVERYVESSAPGVRVPHVWLDDGACLFDRLGSGFTLLRIGANAPDCASLIDQAGRDAIPFSTLDLPADAEGKFSGYPLVLVRPDQHVAWRGMDAPHDPKALLDVIAGRTSEGRKERAYTLAASSMIAGAFTQPMVEGARIVAIAEGGSLACLSADTPGGFETVQSGVFRALAAGTDGRVLAIDSDDNLVAVGNGTLEPIADLSGLGLGARLSLAALPDGGIVVADRDRSRLVALDAGGIVRSRIELDDEPVCVASQPSAGITLVGTDAGMILQLRLDGTGRASKPHPFARATVAGPGAVMVDEDGSVWVAGAARGSLTHLDRSGELIGKVTGFFTFATACVRDPATGKTIAFGRCDEPAKAAWMARIEGAAKEGPQAGRSDIPVEPAARRRRPDVAESGLEL
ncbi:hypothetical protein GC173_14710 [bacterium]|nr:hypothetical protein [bacterium]